MCVVLLLLGWGSRIRTYEMSESESDALPLGDTPICIKIIAPLRFTPFTDLLWRFLHLLNKVITRLVTI